MAALLNRQGPWRFWLVHEWSFDEGNVLSMHDFYGPIAERTDEFPELFDIHSLISLSAVRQHFCGTHSQTFGGVTYDTNVVLAIDNGLFVVYLLSVMDANPITFRYNPEKGDAMLEYLLQRLEQKFNYLGLVKLAFFADRYHIRNYARPVSCDSYYAMKLGPVPSNLLNSILIENYEGKNLKLISQHDVALIGESETIGYLSETDVEALDFVVENFARIGKADPFYLADLSHAYPEWARYEDRFLKDKSGREDMFYEDFVRNADPNNIEFRRFGIKDPYVPLTEQEAEAIIEEMREYSHQIA